MGSFEELCTKLTLFWYTTGLGLRLYDSEQNIKLELILSSQKNQFAKDLEILLHSCRFDEPNIQYHTNALLEHYLFYRFYVDNLQYCLLCGPCSEIEYSSSLIISLLPTVHMTPNHIKEYQAYFRSLPHYSDYDLHRFEPMLNYLLRGELKKPDLVQKTSVIQPSIPLTEESKHHHTFRQTQEIIDAIVTADRNRLMEVLLRPSDGSFGTLSINDPIRSYKNLFISSITEATNAVISHGVNSETAYSLSDSHIQKLETLTRYEDITNLFLTMYHSFIDLMEQYKKTRYTKPVYLTTEYIQKHIAEKITIQQLADYCSFSKVHLARLFKQQTGVVISDYIRQERLALAQKYLRDTSLSIARIAISTGFTDQSHLTRLFHAKYHITPKAYRETI